MKFIFKSTAITCLTIINILVITSLSFAQVAAPDPTSLVQDFTIKIDKLGNANVELSQKMDQAQWEMFKQGPLANDPSTTRRDMERSMSMYVMENFNRTLDDMNRTVKMTLDLKAAAQYDGNGNWEFKWGVKNPVVTKLSDNSYMMTSNTYMGNALVQQVYKLFFPAGASNVQQTTDSFGKPVFTYSSGGGFFSFLTWTNILGGILILVAIVLFVRQKPTQKLSLLQTDQRIANT